MKKKVYISYSGESSNFYDRYADYIAVPKSGTNRASVVAPLMLRLLKNNIECKEFNSDNFDGNIDRFRNELAENDYIVIILSNKYLISPQCMIEWHMILEYGFDKKKIWCVFFDDETIRDKDGNELLDSNGKPFAIKNFDFCGEDKEYYDKLIRPCLEKWRNHYVDKNDDLSVSMRENDCYSSDFGNMSKYLCRNSHVVYKTSGYSVDALVNELFVKISQSIVDSSCEDEHQSKYVQTNSGNGQSFQQVQNVTINNNYGIKEEPVKKENSPCSVRVYALGQYFDIEPVHFKYGMNMPPCFDGNEIEYYGREDEVKNVHKLFWGERAVKILSIVAIGGTGKTFFAHKYKKCKLSSYVHIHHIYLNTDIDDDFVEQMSHFTNNAAFSQALSNANDLRKIEGIVDVLNQCVAEPSLLILDVNVTDKELFKKQILVNCLLNLNDNWRVMLLSRLPFSKKIKTIPLKGFENEPETAFEMFYALSGVDKNMFPKKMLEEVFSSPGFNYHPLLISVMAGYCKRPENQNFNSVKELLDGVVCEPTPDDMENGEENVMLYLDKLISFDSYGKDCEIILRHFMLWEYTNVPFEVVKAMLSGYDIKSLSTSLDELLNDMILTKNCKEYRVNGMTIKEQCDMIYRNNNQPEGWKYVDGKEMEFVEQLKTINYPVKTYVGYRMHGLIGDTLRKKAAKDNYDYSIYINTLRTIMSAPESMNEIRSLYHNIYESLFNYNYILHAPDDLVFLMAAHWAYYPSDIIREVVTDRAKKVIGSLKIDYLSDYAGIDNLAMSIHDFAVVLWSYYKGKDYPKKFAKKSIEIRKGLSKRQLSIEDKVDNEKKLAYEHFFLDMIDSGLFSFIKDPRRMSEAIHSKLNGKCSPIPEMIFVDGGEYEMGCEEEGRDNEENPVHNVYVNDFHLGIFPVTQRQWDYLMGDTIPSCIRVDYHRGLGPDYPMYNVNWFEAAEYCNRLSKFKNLKPAYRIWKEEENGRMATKVQILKKCDGYRLPSEAEWEYAARGGNKTSNDEKANIKYSGTMGDDIGNVAWFLDNSRAMTHRVGEKHHNELGLFDMTGNVWEWCQDEYDSVFYKTCLENPEKYKNNPCNDEKIVASGASRVLRGGSWDYNADDCRVSCRSDYAPGDRGDGNGFRLLLSSPKKEKI